MSIDWTLPCETTETPPRPVRVLATDRPNPDRPIVVMRDDGQVFTVGSDGIGNPQGYANGTYGRITLRNVAPPKPDPVQWKTWVSLYHDGRAIIASGPGDTGYTTSDLVERRCIDWMSDGSPVPVEDDPVRYGVCEVCVEKSVKRCDVLVAERDRWQAECEHWAGTSSSWIFERDALKAERDKWWNEFDTTRTELALMTAARDKCAAEVERLTKANLRILGEIGQMRPVVEAAVEWASDSKKAYAHLLLQLQDAVRAYQATLKKNDRVSRPKIYTFTRDVPDGSCQDWEMK
jgi:hypothetical protein